jgi:hypothetical protein
MQHKGARRRLQGTTEHILRNLNRTGAYFHATTGIRQDVKGRSPLNPDPDFPQDFQNRLMEIVHLVFSEKS